jgi:hypothetical protein
VVVRVTHRGRAVYASSGRGVGDASTSYPLASGGRWETDVPFAAFRGPCRPGLQPWSVTVVDPYGRGNLSRSGVIMRACR